MNKSIFIFLLVFIYGPSLVWAGTDCGKDKNAKCVKFSGDTIKPDCKPVESNDCLIKDATVSEDGDVGAMTSWPDFILRAKLPPQSWTKTLKNTEQEFEWILYPFVGKHYILGGHDFEIIVKVTKTTDYYKPFSCISFDYLNKYSEVTTDVGSFRIEVKNGLNYFYHGGPGSNPNPYTSEVDEILLSVLKSVKVGTCN